MKIERKTFNAADFKATDAAQGIAEMIVSVFGNVDGGNEIIMPGFFAESIASRRTADGRPKAKGVFCHDWESPIAKTLDARELYAGDPMLPPHLKELGGLWVKGQFNLDTQRGREAFSDLQFGTMDEFSIGYGVTQDKWNAKTGVRELIKGDWYEWSPVLVGMNSATALISTKSAQLKAAVPFKATDKAPEDEAWSAPALKDFTDKAWGVLTDAEKKGIMGHFAYTTNMPPESYGDMKLPHHRPSDMMVVWNGVAAGAARMNQMKDIPAADMKAIASHMAGHYKQFEKDIPQSMQDMMKAATKAADFNTVRATAQAQEDLGDLRWELQGALRESVGSILSDDNLDTPTKLAMIRTSIAQYGEALINWAGQALALAASGIDVELDGLADGEHKGQTLVEHSQTALAAGRDVVSRYKALAAELTKEGRAISQARLDRMAALRDAMRAMADDMDAMMAEANPPPAKGLGTMALDQRLALHKRRLVTLAWIN